MKRTVMLISKRIIAIITVIAITVSLYVNMEYMKADTATGIYSVSAPGRAADGTVTWDKITFGNYRQDAYFIKNPIKWRILSIDGDDAFLLADKVLDCKPLHDNEEEDVTWRDCTLRGWLNSEFINEAFSEEEQKDIKYTHVVTGYSDLCKDEYGNPIKDTVETDDRIYIMSEEEAGRNSEYGFAGNIFTREDEVEPRGAGATDYAYYNGKEYWTCNYDYYGKCRYWLRTKAGGVLGFDQIYHGGGLSSQRENVSLGIRPVLHISISSSHIRPAGSVNSAGRTCSDSITASDIINNTNYDSKDIKTVLTDNTYQDSVGNVYHSPVVLDGISTWDCVYFGQYKDICFERKPIEWRVLSVDDDGNALILSDKSIDCMPYNTVAYDELTWEHSSLRKWLNEEFLNTAFSDEEMAAIVEQKLVNEDGGYPSAPVEGGDDTNDRVFVLANSDMINTRYGFDIEFYKLNVNNRAAKLTDYAYLKCGTRQQYNEQYPEASEYWLRTSGFRTGYSYKIDWDGQGNSWAANSLYGVRPALVINLNDYVWEKAGTVKSTDIEEEMSSPKVYPTIRPDVTPEPTASPKPEITLKPTMIPENENENESDEYTEINSVDFQNNQEQKTVCSCMLSDNKIATILINSEETHETKGRWFTAIIYNPADNRYSEYELDSKLDNTLSDVDYLRMTDTVNKS